MGRQALSIENDRLVIRGLGARDLEGLRAMRRDNMVYRFEPAYLLELQGSVEEALELVTAHVLPGNKASARCLLKNGFEYLLTKEEDWGHGSLCTADVYTFDC